MIIDHKYPYSNFHDLNLDYILDQISTWDEKLSNFVSLNTVKYADPFDWDITKQYETNTIVFDPYTQTAYLSVQPVPSGVGINRTEYWTAIFTLRDIYDAMRAAISDFDFKSTEAVNKAVPANAILWLDNVLYIANQEIPIGAYAVPGTNITLTTVKDEFLKILSAIDVTDTQVSDLDTLVTQQFTSVNSQIQNINDRISNLATDYIDVEKYGAVGDGVTDDGPAMIAAMNAANEAGLPLQFHNGKVYAVFGSPNLNPKVGIDFQGATLRPLNPEGNIISIKAEDTQNSTIGMNNIYSSSISGHANKVFKVQTPLSMGPRSGSGVEMFVEKLFITDGQSNFINDPRHWTQTTGTANIINEHTIPNSRVFIRNVIIDYSAQGAGDLKRLINIQRSCVDVDNVHIIGRLPADDNFQQAVILVEACAFVNINNVFGANPVPVQDQSGYIIELSVTSNVSITNCCLRNNAGGSWGAIGTHQETNLTVENVITNRVDVHYVGYGYINVRNSSMQYATLTGGWCNYTFENCIFTGVSSNISPACIKHRTDVEIPLQGGLYLNKCLFVGPAVNWIQDRSFNGYTWTAYTRTKISIDGSVFDYFARGINVDYKFADSTYANGVDIEVRNCTYTYVTDSAIARGRNGTQINSIKVYNCNWVIDSNCNIIAAQESTYNPPKNLIIDHCKTIGTFVTPARTNYVLRVENSEMKDILNTSLAHNILASVVFFINNIIGTDTALFTGTNKRVASNNYISASTHTKSADINPGIVY